MDGNNFFTFPSIKRLYNTSINELCSCGTGFRAKTIKSIAERIVDGSINIDELRKYGYSEAKELLLSIGGIGNKIADCILLFSLEKTEAFPIDIWIARSLYAYYRSLFSEQTSKLTFKSAKLTVNQYNLLSKIMQEHFGKYAGYAQQYLYYHMRHQANKKW
jgi:N-glycosylase/DNA lyase